MQRSLDYSVEDIERRLERVNIKKSEDAERSESKSPSIVSDSKMNPNVGIEFGKPKRKRLTNNSYLKHP